MRSFNPQNKEKTTENIFLLLRAALQVWSYASNDSKRDPDVR